MPSVLEAAVGVVKGLNDERPQLKSQSGRDWIAAMTGDLQEFRENNCSASKVIPGSSSVQEVVATANVCQVVNELDWVLVQIADGEAKRLFTESWGVTKKER